MALIPISVFGGESGEQTLWVEEGSPAHLGYDERRIRELWSETPGDENAKLAAIAATGMGTVGAVDFIRRNGLIPEDRLMNNGQVIAWQQTVQRHDARRGHWVLPGEVDTGLPWWTPIVAGVGAFVAAGATATGTVAESGAAVSTTEAIGAGGAALQQGAVMMPAAVAETPGAVAAMQASAISGGAAGSAWSLSGAVESALSYAGKAVSLVQSVSRLTTTSNPRQAPATIPQQNFLPFGLGGAIYGDRPFSGFGIGEGFAPGTNLFQDERGAPSQTIVWALVAFGLLVALVAFIRR